tara:strand:- start:2446 stop:3369 length:924 start_codon:yes stop_codon:yes gene_type:complete
MKYNILITDVLIKQFLHVYKKDFSVDCLWKLDNKIEFSKYQGVVVTGGFKTDKKFLKKFKNLKIVSVFGIGFDGVDLNYCKNNKIVITNTPKVLTDDVADLALGLMITLSRKINEAHNFILKKKWNKKPFDLTNSLTNKTVGIVGMGEIGKAFAKRAKSLSMKIVYYGPNKKNLNYKYFKNLKDMASLIDVMVITCIGGRETKHLIDKSILKLMKNSSIIVNVSRGSVINELHLLDVLKKNLIGGAALDVFKMEPKINNKFLKLNNVLLSPHNGSGTLDTREKMAIVSSQNISDFLNSNKLKNQVNY